MNALFKVILALTLAVGAASAEAKKFKRALVIAGGGISPAVSVGLLKAAEESGWMPDVVITTCGSSMGAAIYNAYLNGDASLAYAQSPTFYAGLRQVRLNNSNLLDIGRMFDGIQARPDLVPDFFRRYILEVPTPVNMQLPSSRFNTSSRGPRFIMIAAKALFNAVDVGRPRPQKMFTETFFTDPDTAKALKGYPSALADIAGSSVTRETLVISDKTTDEAMRASVSDPYLLNPPIVDGSFYFTGAVDLFPAELAQYLADDVLMTYPVSLFDGPMDIAFSSAFGFTQTRRTLQVLNNYGIRWIDMSGIEELKFDPRPQFLSFNPPSLLTIVNRIPETLLDFQKGIRAQFDLSRARMHEALQLQAAGPNRDRLREPINPKLYESFTCANANAWTTMETTRLCLEDKWAGCDRRRTHTCRPVR